MLGVKRALELTALGKPLRADRPVIDERAIVNGVIGLHATGGSTNLTIHLVAMAAAAGIALRWEDFADLAEVTPLLTRVYPNGKADVNHFHAAGGMGVLIRELHRRRAVARRRTTISGECLAEYAIEPHLDAEGASPGARPPNIRAIRPCCAAQIIRSSRPGGLRVLEGPLGRAVIKTSAVAPERHPIEAPARVFHAGRNCTRPSGPATRPRLRRRRPLSGTEGDRHAGAAQADAPARVLQDRGHRVALVTDGRLSGASGKVPSAIHVTPEAAAGGPIAGFATATSSVSTRPRAGSRSSSRTTSGREGRMPSPTFPRPTSASAANCLASSAALSARPTRARRYFAPPDRSEISMR